MSVLSGVLAKLRSSEPRPNGKESEPAARPHDVPRAAPAPAPPSNPDLEAIAAEARYHRDRLALYRARMHGAADGTSLPRLRELERAAARRIEVRREAAEAFDRELRTALQGTVWHSGCTNWYVDENGNDPSQWPWLWSDYRKRVSTLAPGAYELGSPQRERELVA